MTMRIRTALLCAILLLTLSVPVFAADVEDELLDGLNNNAPTKIYNVIITLSERVDLGKLVDDLKAEGADRAKRHFRVVTELQDVAALTQEPLLEKLESAKSRGQVLRIRPFWISNQIAITATGAYLSVLLHDRSIESIMLDRPISLIAPVGEPVKMKSLTKGIENGVVASRAPELWAMGIDGTGTLVCDQDTGADGNHVAFADRWRGLEPGVTPGEAWFDPVGSETFPTDSGSHGTHTMGTILGDDGLGHQTGMAPGAKWIGAKTVDVPGGNILTDAVAAFQWMADPDGNPATVDDVPDAANNSWGLPYGTCDTTFNDAIDAAEAAGVVVIFAAGNEGPTAGSLRSPGNRIDSDLNAFSIGALKQDNETVASFSSRGPSDCDNATIKPEVMAVGENVLSSFPNDEWGTLSGTSMATPHVTGAILLLRQAFPDATPEEIKYGLYMSAHDLGAAGEDNTYGRGVIDVVDAYLFLLTYLVDSDARLRMGSLYNCSDSIELTVSDLDVTGANLIAAISSNTESTQETVSLGSTVYNGIYEGTVDTTSGAASNGDGMLSLSDGDTITFTYIDADDGAGNVNVVKTKTALADCQPPSFAGLTSATAGDYYAELEWNTATDTHMVSYNIYRSQTSGGQNFASPVATTGESPWTDKNVQNGQTYYYVVRAEDAAGNEDGNTVEYAASPVGPDRIFEDDFEAKGLADWTIVNGGVCRATWTDQNPEGESSPWWQGKFAIVDHGECILGAMDEELITPELDCSHYTGIELAFSHAFEQGFNERGDVDYSLDGTNWINVARYSWQDFEGDENLDLSVLDGEPVVYIRFHYYKAGLTAYNWGIDEVEVKGWPVPDDDDDAVDDDDAIDDDDNVDDDDDDTVDDDDAVDDDDTIDDDDLVDDDDVVDDDDTIDDDDNSPISDDDDSADDDDSGTFGGDDDDDDGCGC